MARTRYPEIVARIAQLSIELGLQQTESIRRQATAGSSAIVTDKRVELLQPKATAELKRFADRYDAVKQLLKDERAAEEQVAERQIKQEATSSEGGVAIKREKSLPDADQRKFTNEFGSSETHDGGSNRVKEWAAGVEYGTPALDRRAKEEAFDVSQGRSRFQDGYEGDMKESPGARVDNPSNKGKGKASMGCSSTRSEN